METFWGGSSTFWTAMAAIASAVSTLMVVVTLWFIYRQVRVAAKAFELDAICRLQQLVDDFRDDRYALFRSCPLDLVALEDQFPKRPPSKHRSNVHRQTSQESLTPSQLEKLQSMSDKLRGSATRVIDRLNDIGQLVEDGFVDQDVFFGKYHVMVMQCCHATEAIRRHEERRRGGNYGQRLLRLRSRAATYNDIWPKHRNVSIKITVGGGSRVIYKSPSPTLGKRILWALRRWLKWY